jgi:hypothetical protein
VRRRKTERRRRWIAAWVGHSGTFVCSTVVHDCKAAALSYAAEILVSSLDRWHGAIEVPPAALRAMRGAR